MSDDAASLSPAIRAHLAVLVRNAGLDDTEESRARMASAWLRKKSMFEGQVKALDMRQLAELSADDPRGALLLTWSGSLVSVGPLETGGRRVEYASIELRTDVPRLAVTDGSRLDGSLRVDAEAVFTGGPVRSTSAVLLIAACDPSVPAEEQAKRIREATIFLTNGFLKINRTVALPGGGFPELFTMRTIVGYLAEKNGVSRKLARQILEDYVSVLESGLLLGHRVPLGKMGRLFLRMRPARKARVGLNPASGARITIPARPPQAVPRISFSRLLKDRAREAAAPEGPEGTA
ncbi:MAG TPA: HU family DNA-binding protein [Spirochaetia bacterium]|nr:HU family DNA-binding protein [Spirochaetia bacterium]